MLNKSWIKGRYTAFTSKYISGEINSIVSLKSVLCKLLLQDKTTNSLVPL